MQNFGHLEGLRLLPIAGYYVCFPLEQGAEEWELNIVPTKITTFPQGPGNAPMMPEVTRHRQQVCRKKLIAS